MKAIYKKDFLLKVMSVMNEPGVVDAQGGSFMGADSTGIDRLIEVSYPDAWTRISKVVARIWLGNKSFKTSSTTVNVISGGGIATHALYAAGTGYNTGETLNVTNTNGEQATILVDTVVGGTNGPVATYTLLTAGSNYSSGPNKVTTSNDPNGGAGFALVINSIAAIVTTPTTTTTTIAPVASLSEGIGYIPLPDDFYLLTKFKMVGWEVPAMEASVNNQRVANMQSNENTRGSRLRPSVVIDIKDVQGVIKPVLVYYSLQKGLTQHVVDEALYVPMVEELKDKDDNYELGITEQVIVPLAYLCAATVFTLLEKPQVAAGLEARAEAMLPGLISLKGTNATVKQ